LDWVKTRDRTVVYPSLPPGNYRFLVRSSANEDWTEAEVVSWSFIINKPFWETWWFISGLILLISVSISAIMRIRLNYIRRKESITRQKVQSQFETLRNQVNPHFLFNSFNTLISTIEQDPEEAVNYVERLSDYFRVVLEQRDKDVITLKEELELVENYLFLQQKRFGKNLVYNIQIKDPSLKSLVPPMTIQILIENAIKHNIISKQRPFLIEIVEENGHLLIRNNLQPKLLKEPSTGIGLENIKNRYRILFDCSIIIRETAEMFIVELPIKSITV
jgi:LytS/YehU family sensor histidine kinase